MKPATALILSMGIVFLFTPSKNCFAQQGSQHPSANSPIPQPHKIIPKSGIWFAKFEGDQGDKSSFWFEVKAGLLPGVAGISYVVSCGGFSESAPDYWAIYRRSADAQAWAISRCWLRCVTQIETASSQYCRLVTAMTM